MLSTQNSNYLRLTILLLSLILWYEESFALFIIWDSAQTSWISQLSVIAYFFIFSVGIYNIVIPPANNFLSICINKISQRIKSVPWIIVNILLLIFTWLYLFSPIQNLLTNPWLQILFALSLTILIKKIALTQNWKTELQDIFISFAIFIFPRIVYEARTLTNFPAFYRGTFVVTYLLLTFLVFLSYHPLRISVHEYFLKIRNQFISRQPRIYKILFIILGMIPIYHLYLVKVENYVQYINTRFLIMIVLVWVTAYLLGNEKSKLISSLSFLFSLGLFTLIYACIDRLLLVVDYPFSLTWSEGNRFYDYSLIFRQSLYNYKGIIENPYSSPGRYGLWGIIFLLSDSSIWLHRFWNFLLHILPPLLFGYLITQKIEKTFLRHTLMIWIGLCLIVLYPLHPPLIVASCLFAFFAFDTSLFKRCLSLFLSGFYIGISRWTWAFLPGALGVLVDLFIFYPHRSGTWLKRIYPTMLLGIVGILPGLIPNLNLFQTTISGSSLTAQQPLLWYRLLPNDTLGFGILLLTLLYTGPVVAFVINLIYTNKIILDWLQKTTVFTTLIGFLIVGLIISTKIGGGGDLHNLDMYLITLLTITCLCITIVQKAHNLNFNFSTISILIFFILLPVYSFTPFHPNATHHSRLDLTDPTTTSNALIMIQQEVKQAQKIGEVLFMDQRQLITFGYINNISFVPEYEKKYMMDQAMASNQKYFEAYYQDLKNKRFALIVSEPLKIVIKQSEGIFSEENDAWVSWVSSPTLCYYEPFITYKEIGVQLLVPKKGIIDCENELP